MNAHASSSKSASPDRYRPPKLKMKLKESETEREERLWRKEHRRLRRESKQIYRANGLRGDEGDDYVTSSTHRDKRQRRYWEEAEEGARELRRDGTWTTPPRHFREESMSPPRKQSQARGEATSDNLAGGLPFSARAMNLDVDPDFDFSAIPPVRAAKAARESAAAELEELQFRQKLFDLMEDEEGPTPLVSGRYKSPSPPPPQPIPARWRETDRKGKGLASSGVLGRDQQTEEEYAESIRYGMWRLKHKDEVERQERLAALRLEEERKKDRLAAERAKEEKKRIEVLQKEKGKEEERRREADRLDYANRWRSLKDMLDLTTPTGLSGQDKPSALDGPQDRRLPLGLVDLPWPIYRSHQGAGVAFNPALLTRAAIEAFLFSPPPPATPEAGSNDKAHRRRTLREAILAYHPDRFLGRYLDKVKEGEREVVREAVGRVSGVINDIMADEAEAPTG